MFYIIGVVAMLIVTILFLEFTRNIHNIVLDDSLSFTSYVKSIFKFNK